MKKAALIVLSLLILLALVTIVFLVRSMNVDQPIEHKEITPDNTQLPSMQFSPASDKNEESIESEGATPAPTQTPFTETPELTHEPETPQETPGLGTPEETTEELESEDEQVVILGEHEGVGGL